MFLSMDMQINSISSLNLYSIRANHKNYCLQSFGANIHSAELAYSPCDFFIKLPEYGKSLSWVNRIIKATDVTAEMITKEKSFDEVLQYISKNVREANSRLNPLGCKNKIKHSGILRTKRNDWDYNATWENMNICTPYGSNAIPSYKTYESRFDDLLSNPIDNPFSTIKLTVADYDYNGKFLKHPGDKLVNNALNLVKERYDYLNKKYIKPNITPDLKDVNNKIAEMRWILAHSMPFERGSDSISNIFMKAMYKSMGIKTYSPAKGISFDLEAFCTNLDKYKANFPNYFKKSPILLD